MNIFAAHYYLWFAALTPIYGYVSVYAEHYANASSSQYGLLNMVLPFATILAQLFFCSSADRYRAHKLYFVYFLILALIGYGSYAILPLFVEPQSKNLGLNLKVWITICTITTVSTISLGVITCLSDSFAVDSASKTETSYGRIRLWGTIGWASGSLAIAFINQTQALPILVPGLILTIVLLLADIVLVVWWPRGKDFEIGRSDSTSTETFFDKKLNQDSDLNIKQQSSNKLDQNNQHAGLKTQWIILNRVARRRPSIFRYATIFTISGALMSVQWSFFFQYLKRIYIDDFAFITGLSMVAQSLLGELPFFLLSNLIVSKLGRAHTLSFSLLAMGLRYLLYLYLLPNSNKYFVMITETFQGPSFGLLYVVMTEVALDYSYCDEIIVEAIKSGDINEENYQVDKLRLTLRATMQSLMSACYEGLGVGVGSIVGGIVIDQYGFENLWFWSALIALVSGLVNSIIDIFTVKSRKDPRGNGQETAFEIT